MILKSLGGLLFAVSIAEFDTVVALAKSSERGVSAGMPGIGSWTLGDVLLSNNYDLIINSYPSGASMLLSQGVDVSSQDHITITATGGWKPTVRDLNMGNNKGKMRKYNDEGYANPDIPLEYKFKILVDSIRKKGEDGDIIEHLTDAIDLANPVDILKYTQSVTIIKIDLMYSQKEVLQRKKADIA